MPMAIPHHLPPLLFLLLLASSSAAAKSGFISTRATHFFLDGAPFYAHGFNAYWLMYAAADPSQRGLVSAALHEQTSPGSYKGLDFVVSEARKYGVILILSMVKQYVEANKIKHETKRLEVELRLKELEIEKYRQEKESRRQAAEIERKTNFLNTLMSKDESTLSEEMLRARNQLLRELYG